MKQRLDFTLATRVQQNAEIIAMEMDGEAVLLNLETAHYYGMPKVSSRIWSLIAEPHTIGEVCDSLMQQFDVDRETCEKEVMQFVKVLRHQGLIDVLPEKID